MLQEQRSQLSPAWGPGDDLIAFGHIRTRETSLAIELLDLKTNKVTELPGSQDLWVPAWSPDGKYLVAVASDYHLLKLYDFTTGKWSSLPQGPSHGNVGNSYFSHDSKYVYFEDDNDETLYRVRLPIGQPERVASFKGLRQPAMPYWDRWWGLTPDDSLLAVRDLGTWEIYAFDIQP